MTFQECRVGMLVRAVGDLAQGFWATGLLLGRIVDFDKPFVIVKCISHGREKAYEGDNLCCNPEHLVLVIKPKDFSFKHMLRTCQSGLAVTFED